MRATASLRMVALGAVFVLFSISGVFSLGGSGQEITLTFADGLAPSAKGWTFQGHDQFQQPLTESQVASVSGGVLHLDTVPFGGVGSNETLAFWQIPIANIDPSNYEYEIRMRAIAPNSFRNCFGGLLGAGIEVRANFDSDVTVMQPQVHVGGFAPASSSDPCLTFSTDASVFHTYKLAVQDDTQATFFIDGVQIAQGVLTRANTLSLEAVFGDLSTSGGNVTADIEFIRIASLTRMCVPPPANLVAWWPGDGDANDIIGVSEGSLQNGATFAPAMVGQAFHLDGVDDFVQVQDNPNQSPSSITIEMWVLAEAIDGLRPIITKYNPLPIGSSWFVEVSEGQIRWGVFPNPTSSWRSVHTASAVISPGAWHHVAVTFDSSSAAMQVYVDGAEAPSVLDSAAPVAAIADSEGPLRIGAEVNAAGTLGGVWKGLIDEAAIFDRALPASEIQAIFSSGSAGKCKINGPPACSPPPSGMVSWWRADGSANDTQGSNQGTLYGGASFALGKVEQAFTFDGLDDFVEIAENGTLDLNDDFTIETWVRPEQLTNDSGTPVPIVSKYDFSNEGWGNASYEASLHGDGRVQFGVTCGQTDMFQVTDNSVVSVGTFAHIATVYRRTPVTSLEIYVNGVLQPGTTLGSCSSINQNDIPFRIGMRRDSSSTAFFRGQIDEVSVYSRALSASEIQRIFDAGSAGKCRNAQLAELGEAKVWLGLKNSDDVGTKFDLLAEVFKNGSLVGSGQLNSVPGGSSGFNNAVLRTTDLALSAPTDVHTGDTLSIKLSVRIAVNVSGHRSGTARLWFNDAAATSRFDATIGAVTNDYFLLDGFTLGSAAGLGPKKTIDVFVDRAAGGNPFKPFGTWSKTF